MPPELQSFADILGPYAVPFMKICTVLFTLRITFMKLAQGPLKRLMERMLSRVGDTTDPNDDRLASSVLQSRSYRIFAFIVDMFFSVKLPLELSPKKRDGE